MHGLNGPCEPFPEPISMPPRPATLPVLPTTRWSCRGGALVLLVVMGMVNGAELSAQTALPPSPAESATSTTTRTLLDDRPIGSLKASLGTPAPTRPADAAGPYLKAKAAETAYIDCGRPWCLSPYEWDAPNTKSLPLYFEEPNLERLGYYYGVPQDGTLRHVALYPLTKVLEAETDEFWLKQRYFQKQAELDYNQPQLNIMQPLVSAATFYGRVAFLPYMWGVHHAKDPIYDLGEDTPGSPVPYRKHYVTLSLKGALMQGTAMTGLGYLIP